MRTTKSLLKILALLPAALFLLSGCAYFNTYYNAKKLYNSVNNRHTDFPDTTIASQSEKSDLTKAVDKFAAVALKYPNSRWALPSLYYMGNSYLLSRDYDKAARKYQEIWQYYPNSKYADMAQFNNALISFNLQEWDRTIWSLTQIKSNDKIIVERSAFLEALAVQSIPDYKGAAIRWERFLLKYYKSDLANKARFNFAVCLSENAEYSNAARELEMILGKRIRSDFRYQVSMKLGQNYQITGQYQKALALYKKLHQKQTIKERIAEVEIEIANCLSHLLPTEKAVQQYQDLATKYSKTETASIALFRIAEIYENRQELDSAFTYFNKARNEVSVSRIKEQALKRSVDISLLKAYRLQSGQEATEQSAKLQFLMAEHYLFGLNKPDSAFANYFRVARDYSDQPLAAKAWFAAGWTALKFLSDSAKADSIFYVLIEKYPVTRYANGARSFLNLPLDTAVNDIEPEIEMNVKPLEQKKDTTSAKPDSTDITAPQNQSEDGQTPDNIQIPRPPNNRGVDTR